MVRFKTSKSKIFFLHHSHQTEPGQCRVSGDPHYTTFDGKHYSYQGDCEYTLIRPCNYNPDDDSVVDFHLWGNNLKNNPSNLVSFMRGFTLEYNGTSFTVQRENKVYVNGRRLSGSFFSYGTDVVIQWDSEYLVIPGLFSLIGKLFGPNSLILKVSSTLWFIFRPWTKISVK